MSVLRVSEADLAVLRRVVLAAPPPKTPVPGTDKPSIPVRAAKATGRGALIGSAVVGAMTLLGALDPELVRGLVAFVRMVGDVAGAVRDAFGG